MNYKEYINKVGLEVSTLLSPFTTSSYGAKGSRVFIGRSGNKIEAVVLHTTGNTASAKNEATNIHNNKPANTGSSFHAVVDEYGVYECVLFKNTAYHAGNKDKNLKTLGFELTDDNASAGYENYIKYIAWVMHQENIVPSVSTVLFHNEIVATSCGAFLRSKGKTQIIADLNKYIAIAKGNDKPVVKPVVKPPTKKTNEQLAEEVKKGLWGNDPQRSKKLSEAGYDPKAVQAIVNGGVSVKPPVTNTYINLHPKTTQYAVYKVNLPISKMHRPNNFANLAPNNMGGLSYVAKKVADTSNVYEIKTRDFGKVHIALVAGISTITNVPLYKVF